MCRIGRDTRSPGQVDVWHASRVGLYKKQDSEQAAVNLRGKFTTDAKGRFWLRTVRPDGYPIPTDGVVGRLLKAQNHNAFRPAHVPGLIVKEGFWVLISQVYASGDPHIETDATFGVTRAPIGEFRRHDGPCPQALDVQGPGFTLEYTYTMEEGETKLAVPPIQ